MARRLELDALLRTVAPNTYFQPPENMQIQYPCIVYSRDYAETQFADNAPYQSTLRYQLTVIDPDPDSPILDKVAALPKCVFSRHFVADSLNHDNYNIYF